jgi:hypothetical protein
MRRRSSVTGVGDESAGVGEAQETGNGKSFIGEARTMQVYSFNNDEYTIACSEEQLTQFLSMNEIHLRTLAWQWLNIFVLKALPDHMPGFWGVILDPAGMGAMVVQLSTVEDLEQWNRVLVGLGSDFVKRERRQVDKNKDLLVYLWMWEGAQIHISYPIDRDEPDPLNPAELYAASLVEKDLEFDDADIRKIFGIDEDEDDEERDGAE